MSNVILSVTIPERELTGKTEDKLEEDNDDVMIKEHEIDNNGESALPLSIGGNDSTRGTKEFSPPAENERETYNIHDKSDFQETVKSCQDLRENGHEMLMANRDDVDDGVA